jgi:membrane protease YdiL (CAAX protease family)
VTTAGPPESPDPPDQPEPSEGPGTAHPAGAADSWDTGLTQGGPAAPPETESGIPGRTRPLFEELPPGPPTWPGWVAIALGISALLPALVSASAYLANDGGSFDAAAAGIAALAGLFLVVGGLVWLAVAGVIRRRVLGSDRYRGGSVIGLLAIVVVGGNLAALPILLLLLGGDQNRLNDPFVITVELLLTPASFLIVYALFVALPHALPGVQVWAGVQSVRRLLLGVGLGIGVWLGLGVLSALLNLLIEAVSGSPLGGEQAVAGLATQIPFVSALLAVAVLAPFAEELFFRGAVLNAWEREYGTSRAVMGSALLFALVHIIGGTPLAVVQVFLLGLVLGMVYVRTRSLPTVMGLHGAFNLASVLALFLVR